jgi:DNA processing protein
MIPPNIHSEIERNATNEFSRENIVKVSTDELIGPLNEVEKKYAPRWLYVAGDHHIAEISPRVSVIGARHPSERGLKNAQNLVERLVKRNVVIVSGLASGIDTIAHKTAISNGGKTIAVLGTPLDQCYPKENYSLQKEIIQNHLAISQFPLGYPIRPKNFPIRNRTMALISDASIIVEAGETSGSLHQGWEALRLGRPLLIIDTIVKNRELEWPREMIKYGAKILSIKGTESLFEILPPSGNKVNIDAALYA